MEEKRMPRAEFTCVCTKEECYKNITKRPNELIKEWPDKEFVANICINLANSLVYGGIITAMLAFLHIMLGILSESNTVKTDSFVTQGIIIMLAAGILFAIPVFAEWKQSRKRVADYLAMSPEEQAGILESWDVSDERILNIKSFFLAKGKNVSTYALNGKKDRLDIYCGGDGGDVLSLHFNVDRYSRSTDINAGILVDMDADGNIHVTENPNMRKTEN